MQFFHCDNTGLALPFVGLQIPNDNCEALSELPNYVPEPQIWIEFN